MHRWRRGPFVTPVPEAPVPRRKRVVLAAGTVLAAALLVVVSLLVGARLGSQGSVATPAEGSPEARFARQMSDHHAQAVRMAVAVREATDDPAIDRLALDILLTQQQQIGVMSGWLSSWGLTRVAPAGRTDGGDGMAGMGGMGGTASEGDPTVGDMGMATDEDLAALEGATGEDAERRFLELMIPHHQGAVMMAEAALTEVTDPAVRSLAEKVVASQRSEITYLESLLAERDAA